MRISKEPEVRKQEIIDTAMKVFGEKGYEAVTMKDIAREMNVASGLCYHYFQNKQALYEEAVQKYAMACSRAFIEVFSQTELTVSECIEKLGKIWLTAMYDGSYTYAGFFHEKGNEVFHRQLDMEMLHIILPYVTAYLEALKKRDEINVPDIRAAALFILNGEIGIINDDEMEPVKKLEVLKDFVLKILK